MNKLQEIYDRERNIKLEWFWDAGVEASIGDDMNGWKDCRVFNTVQEAIDWLYEKTTPPL